MTHVITRSCCNDASCVPVCPVGCIHPEPGTAEFATAEMLHIDPATCIDCGACVSACPVAAIVPESELSGTARMFSELNAEYFATSPIEPDLGLVTVPPPSGPVGRERLRVAVVGSGPAGSYAVLELLKRPNVEITVFERLPTPWGLIRSGIAPDHQSTKAVADLFERAGDDARVRFMMNVEVGVDVTHDELAAHHHAVIYAYGASSGRDLGIAGEDLPGSVAAIDVVNWYNGHPDAASTTFDLSGHRAVLIGNGNVALDVARILVSDPDALSRTDIAENALSTLRESKIREVVVLGRRGSRDAAFTTAELLALMDTEGVDVTVTPSPGMTMDRLAPTGSSLRERLLTTLVGRLPRPGRRHVILRFDTAPTQIIGTDRVEGVLIEPTRLGRVSDVEGNVDARASLIDTGLVVRSVGHSGRPIAGVPFDEARGTIPHLEGRVLSGEALVPGVYCVGWIKRGPHGVVGTNRECARETVSALLADHKAGLLPSPSSGRGELRQLLSERQPDVTGLSGWRSIDTYERAAGRASGAPRKKLTDRAGLLLAARRDGS